MSSAYEERVKCLGPLSREKSRLKKQKENAEEANKTYEHLTRSRINNQNNFYHIIHDADEKISKIKKEYAEKLEKDLSGEVKKLDKAKKDLQVSKKACKDYKKSITKNKKLIASNTKKLNKIEKAYKKCYEKSEKKTKSRCKNGTRKNPKTGNCEKK